MLRTLCVVGMVGIFASADAHAQSDLFRWQYQTHVKSNDSRDELVLRLNVWPERAGWKSASAARITVAHGVDGSSGDRVDATLSSQDKENLPLDLAVLVDSNSSKQSRTAVQAVVRNLVSKVPPQSRLRLFSFPHRWDAAGVEEMEGFMATQAKALSSGPEVEYLNVDSSKLSTSADLGGALAHIIGHWPNDASTPSSRSVRALIYVATSAVIVGDVDTVALAAQRQGNIPVFPIFMHRSRKGVKTSTTYGQVKAATERYETGAYSAGAFHYRVASRTGGWVLSDHLTKTHEDLKKGNSNHLSSVTGWESRVKRW